MSQKAAEPSRTEALPVLPLDAEKPAFSPRFQVGDGTTICSSVPSGYPVRYEHIAVA